MSILKKIKVFLIRKKPNICIISNNTILKIHIETSYNFNFINNSNDADIIILSGFFTPYDKNKIEKQLLNNTKFIIYKLTNINTKNYQQVNNINELKDYLCI